jgi:PKD repeat protein
VFDFAVKSDLVFLETHLKAERKIMNSFTCRTLSLLLFRFFRQASWTLRSKQAERLFSRSLCFSVLASLFWFYSASAIVSEPNAKFDWSMPDRFGLDEDGDGVVDIPNTFANAQPSGFTVNLDANSSMPGGSPIVSHYWIIQGNGLSSPITLNGATPSASNLEEGIYSVSLTVADADGRTDSITKTVVVKDILIVALGDSYGSGEGNPDLPIQYDSFGFVKSGARWTDSLQDPLLWGDNRFHSRCHRSAWAGPTQAALSLERADPHTSVTFVFFACSGSSITKGVKEGFRGIEPPTDLNDKLPSQIDQVAAIVGSRRIDALIVSFGGNDIGFSDIVEALVMLGPIGYAIPPGLNLLSWDQAIGPILGTLPDLYDSLNTEIQSKLTVSNVYVTEYPDPTHDGSGQTCTAMLTDVIFPGIVASPATPTGITLPEAEWARSNVIIPLNQAVEAAALKHNWKFVSGISADFLTHGYCAATRAANVPEERWRWIVTAEESVIHQGPVFNLLTIISALDKGQTKGTLHPNFLGHIAYRDHLLQFLTQLDFQPPEITCPTDLTMQTDSGNCSAMVNLPAISATDNVPGVKTSCTPLSGSAFQKGVTNVVCTATDSSGNTASCSFKVTVVDQEKPLMTCPANQSVAATSPMGAAVNYTDPSVTDNCGGSTISCSIASGSTFAIGTTIVTCTATDSAVNQASCSFSITVKGAAEQLNDLINAIKNYGIQSGLENSLLVKLQAALAAVNTGNPTATCLRLNDFINEVNAQAGKKFITAAQASQLLAAAQQIKKVLGCA